MSSITKLKRTVEMRAGGTPAVDDASMWDEKGLPWVAITDMTKAARVVQTGRRVSSAGVAAKSLPIGRPGTLLFAMYASVGAVSVLGTEGSWNQAILGMEPRPGLTDARFVRYWLEHLKPDLIAITRSNTQDNLNAEQVGNLPFPVLSLSTQRVIADYLDRETARIDALVAAKRRMAELLEERFRAQLMELLFVGWAGRLVPIGRICSCLAGYSFPSAAFVHNETNAIKLLRGANVTPSGLRWDDVVYFPRSRVDAGIEAYALCAGDLVVGMDRPVIRSGMRVAAVHSSDLPAFLVQRVARIRANSLSTTAFVRYLLKSQAFRDHFSPITTGVSVPHISEEQILSFRVPMMTAPEQAAIASTLQTAESRMARLRAALQNQSDLLHEHRQTLITAAVTGQLDIPEAA